MSKSFFEVKNQTDDKAEIFILGEIKLDKPWYEDGEESKDNYLRDFIRTLQNLKGKELDIHINSPGGALFAGITMYNLLKNHTGNIKVYVDGSAASAASVVALAGNEVIIPKNAFLMVHKPMVRAEGNANDLQKTIDMLNTIEEGMLSIYEDNLINSEDKDAIKQMVNEETWLSGEKAAEYFKNVKVIEEVSITACNNFDFSCYSHTPKELLNLKPIEEASNEVVNKNENDLWKVKLELARA